MNCYRVRVQTPEHTFRPIVSADSETDARKRAVVALNKGGKAVSTEYLHPTSVHPVRFEAALLQWRINAVRRHS